jgi:hypothetical protein
LHPCQASADPFRHQCENCTNEKKKCVFLPLDEPPIFATQPRAFSLSEFIERFAEMPDDIGFLWSAPARSTDTMTDGCLARAMTRLSSSNAGVRLNSPAMAW